MTDDDKQAIIEAVREGLIKPQRDRNRKRSKGEAARHEVQIYTDAQLVQFWQWFNAHWLDMEPEKRRKDVANESHGWHRAAFYCGLIICTGLRREEACCLRVDCCHDQPDAFVEVKHGKGNKYRYADVLPQFVPHYRKYLGERRAKGAKYMFSSYQWPHRPVSYHTGHDWWVRVMDAAGLPRSSPHIGRRIFTSYVTRLKFIDSEGYSFRMDLADLQEQLGHSDLNTTRQHYLRSMPGTRFGQKKILWPDYVCPGYEVPARPRFDMPDNPKELAALIEEAQRKLQEAAP